MEGSEGISKILIFGGTGYIGKYMVKASIKLGHETFVYTRPLTPQSNQNKVNLHNEFQSMGVTIIQGELDEHEKLVDTLRRVDVVISALPFPQVPDQIHIVEAIKVAGNIKRFLPSEFGVEEDRVKGLPPFEACLEKKRKIRRAVEEAGIPYTYVSANCFAAYFVNYLLHPHDQDREDIVVYGSVLLNYEEDVAEYTIKVANDPRTCNRIVIYRMPKNILSQLELISLWEKKTGRNFKRSHVPGEELVKLSETLPHPDNVPVSVLHSIFVKGVLLNFELRENDLEASCLYPDHDYTTIDQLLDVFLVNPPKPASAAF
ncbi:NmrA-like protein [Corchorus olitorius]|uniref:NmrA-like protein n=1 Tax=Corchorus olitorius TaxID=93759 RepID=A0A1R3JBB3_9ROSI|nr:NmrA-like protein [Corchorus olitorius]